MGIIESTLTRAAIWFFGTLIGRGILRYLHTLGLFPEKWIARTMRFTMSRAPAGIGWILAGLFGVVLVAAWIGFGVDQRLQSLSMHSDFQTQNQPPQVAPQSTPPPAPQPSGPQTATYGALYPWQIDILANATSQYSKIVIARPHMVEPQMFSRSFENLFLTLGIEPIVTQQDPNARNQTGVKIGVVDVNQAPSAGALMMQDAIRRMGFDGGFIQLRGDTLESAKQNNEFAIYVGPPPLK
jgi:hypothetical protein